MYTTAKERKNFAKKEIEKINRLLAKNHVFIDKNFVPVADFIKPASEATMLLKSLYNQIDISQHLRVKAAGTFKSSVNSAKKFLKEDIPLTALDSPTIYKMRDFFIKEGNNSYTANKKIEHIGRIYKQVLKRHGIKENPFSEIEKLDVIEISTRNISFTKKD